MIDDQCRSSYNGIMTTNKISQPDGRPIFSAGAKKKTCSVCGARTHHTGNRQNQAAEDGGVRTVWFWVCSECGCETLWTRRSYKTVTTIAERNGNEWLVMWPDGVIQAFGDIGSAKEAHKKYKVKAAPGETVVHLFVERSSSVVDR